MKSLAIIPLGLGIMLAAIPARADNTSCTGPLFGKTINGNLVVPDGASCRIVHVSVTGNVLVGTGASLVVADNVTIAGNLEANRCTTVAIFPFSEPVSIGGSVQESRATLDCFVASLLAKTSHFLGQLVNII
jgi:hypothetical protein